jgi:hypothetical protein
MLRDISICPKRRISRINEGADQVPLRSHEQVKMGKRGWCVACRGLRFGDRPQKRVALSEIASNSRRKSTNRQSRFGYKQCDVFLCKDISCFEVFHKEK